MLARGSNVVEVVQSSEIVTVSEKEDQREEAKEESHFLVRVS